MAISSFVKQSSETFYVYGSILRVQDADEVIILGSSSVTAVDDDGTDVTSTILVSGSEALSADPDGSYVDNALRVRVRAGVATGSPYKLTFLMVTNKGNTYEVDAQMVVRNT